jgi:hypothetical protein
MQNNENKALWAKLNRTESKNEHFLNKTEQYSRLNNLRINGSTELLFDKDGKQVVRNKDGKIRPIKHALIFFEKSFTFFVPFNFDFFLFLST